eukprot:6468878-Amphidinium_carterae.1
MFILILQCWNFAKSFNARLLPWRIVKGDTTFLAAWSFLFFRYNSGAYWYGPVVLARNALVAMAPILELAVQQIMSLQVAGGGPFQLQLSRFVSSISTSQQTPRVALC